MLALCLLFGARAGAEETQPVSLGYHDGLSLRAGPVSLTVNAAVQARYQAAIVPAPTDNRSGFDLHHAQLALDAEVLGFISVEAMFDFGAQYTAQGGAATVRDLYLEVRPLAWLTVRAGQFKVPFSRQRLVSALNQSFTERALATLAFTFDRDLGGLVQALLWRKRLRLELAITDGVDAGPAVQNDNLDLAYTARVTIAPLGPLPLVEGDRARTRPPRFSLGGAIHYDLAPTDALPPFDDLDHNGRIDNVGVISVDAEAKVAWRGLALEGEYFFRQEEPGFGRANRNFHGGYGQLSAMAWRGLELGARASYAELPALGRPAVGVIGDKPESALEVGGVVNYYFWREACKAQLSYTYRDDTAADPFDTRRRSGHLIAVQLQAGF
jgi:hypothetical protein